MNIKYFLFTLPIIIGLLVIPIGYSDTVTVSADVQPYLTVTFNYNTVGFGTVVTGSTGNHPSPDYTTGVYNVSIDTNTNYTVSAYESGGFINNGLTLYLAVSSDPSIDGTFHSLGTSSTTIYTSSLTTTFEGTEYHQYKLDVGDIPAGSYSTTVTITYSTA